ncbi:MAG: Fur family transcriptional regulator [Solirubrobacteraceae bacterium]
MSGEESATWTEHAFDALEQAGYRRGGARRAVVELLGRQSCAVTAIDIDAALRAGGQTVARASVYRTLEQLAELGLIQRLEVGQGTARYEPVNPSGEHHHHLVCDRCGDVVPFEDRELEKAIARLSRRVAFKVDDHEVVLHGACGACAA